MKKAQRRGRKPKYDFASEDFLKAIKEMAEYGFLDYQIADILGISQAYFSRLKRRFPELVQLLSTSRAQARGGHVPQPSPAYFRMVWNRCNKSRVKTAKAFGVSVKTIYRWAKKDLGIADVIIERDLEIYESLDTVSRIIALGGVKNKDTFPGWSREPVVNFIAMLLSLYRKRLRLDEEPIIENPNKGDSHVLGWMDEQLAAK